MKQQQEQDPSSWIFSLLSEKFFIPCLLHEYSKKNEKNIFCLDCSITICAHCLKFHRSHRLLQVRRYVYHDVIRLDDMEKLFDCSFVQSYSTNNAKVIFLNQRPQSRPFKSSGTVCNTCDRSLQDSYHFCSLACKVQYLVSYEGCISRYLYDCDYLSLSDCVYDTQIEGVKEMDDDDDEGQMTPVSVLDGGMMMSWSYRTSTSGSGSGSGSSSTNNNGEFGCLTVGCTATTENVTRKKRSAKFVAGNVYYRNTPRPVCKRKGIPVRSPLF
ncbi:zinc finger protein [Macleaya cordata]|uniref:Zinc finger protein n=1 Tax=Macleaya cordata TaxID=56857 RepID=A0A200Q244_MACCD|nr:zinc finger protein [Macleaya cordata]